MRLSHGTKNGLVLKGDSHPPRKRGLNNTRNPWESPSDGGMTPFSIIFLKSRSTFGAFLNWGFHNTSKIRPLDTFSIKLNHGLCLGVPHFQHAWFASGFLLVDEESLHCVRLVCMQRQYRRARYLGQCVRPQACCTLAAPGSKADLKTANVRRETFGKRESGRSSIHIFDDGHLLLKAG